MNFSGYIIPFLYFSASHFFIVPLQVNFLVRGQGTMKSIEIIDKDEAVRRMNQWGKQHKPFFFLVSYDEKQSIVCPPDELPENELRFNFNGITNVVSEMTGENEQIEWVPFPESYAQYRKSFEIVRRNLLLGNSFLLNLTCCTPVQTNLSLQEIYFRSRAKYRLWWKGHFVMFSPEIFVQVENGEIKTCPMKGTVEADKPDACRLLMEDEKEAAEHATITDLLRNDLSRIADHVHVKRYRYIDRLFTHKGTLLQTSSEISGNLPADFYEHLGDDFFSLLPAGSVTGAPKKKTIDIIREAEGYDRGFYTGVTGYFDGENLDSAVIIRFVEEGPDGKLYFKSGGGITFRSDCRKEYEEMIEKIYVPIY